MALLSHATIIDNIQSLLGDNTTDFTDAYLTLRIVEGLQELSRYSPFKTRDLRAATDNSKEIDISDIQNLLWVDALEFRIDRERREFREFTEHYNKILSMDIDFWPSDEDSSIDTDEAIDTSETAIDIDADGESALPAGTIIKVENELMYVTAVSTTTLTVVRGYQNTSSVAHTTNQDIYKPENLYLYCAKTHRVSDIADIAGAATATYTASVRVINVDGLSSTGTIRAGNTFTIASDGSGTHYRLTKDVTLSSNAGDFNFEPSLVEAVTEDDVVTVDNSTLYPRLETLLIDLVAARSAISISSKFINKANTGGPNVSRQWLEWGRSYLAITLNKLEEEAEEYQRVRREEPTQYYSANAVS